MKNVIINLYSFGELSEIAKNKAIAQHADFLLSIGQQVENEDGEIITEYSETIEDVEVIESIEANEYLFFADGSLASITHYVGNHSRAGQTEFKLHGETYLISK